MTRGFSAVVAAALGLGVLAGWGVGGVHGDCERTCPAQGPCPTPVDCLNYTFNWTAALVLGVIVATIAAAVGVAMINTKLFTPKGAFEPRFRRTTSC